MAVTSPATRTEWRIIAEEVVSCNCVWACPCQFDALPDKGNCEGFAALDIQTGHFGSTPLDGVRFALVVHWDGPIHEGNGCRRLIVDERATPKQRAALEALTDGAHGHPFFEIFSAMAPNKAEPAVALIEFEVDRERRKARIRIPGIGESLIEPITNPVTGEEHRVRIDLPDGFEYKLAEVADTVRWRTTAGEHLAMEHEHSYAQLARVEWSSDGTTR